MLHAVILSRFLSIFFRIGSRCSRSFSRTFGSPVSASLAENKGVFNRKKTSPITPSLPLYSSELLILRCLFSLSSVRPSLFSPHFSPLSPLSPLFSSPLSPSSQHSSSSLTTSHPSHTSLPSLPFLLFFARFQIVHYLCRQQDRFGLKRCQFALRLVGHQGW